MYVAIDLKSFYASVECVERGLDPLKTNLVVADESRTEKTICLAVTPSLKAYGVSGRARLFEVVQKVREINNERLKRAPNHCFTGESCDAEELREHPEYKLSYIVAAPRMALYMKKSAEIYDIYLKYVAPEDMHVYSVDEVFLDVTHYLKTYKKDAYALTETIIQDVLDTSKITATAGIGPNLYLCKIAMDIVAKHIPADKNGVRIASLTEESYRRLLWGHRPLTDFWRVGQGYARKLEQHGIYTMGDIARCSIGDASAYYNEELLYKLFGVNAELLIDHAWGYEPCTIAQIKAYRPENNSICSGQVLTCPYEYEKAKLVAREMADMLALDLLDKGLVTEQLVLTVGYDIENLTNPDIRAAYKGPVTTDRYGRSVPKHAHGTTHLNRQTASSTLITEAVVSLFEEIANPRLLVRRLYLTADKVVPESRAASAGEYRQLELFSDFGEARREEQEKEFALEREKKMQQAVLSLQKKYGKNAVLKGMNLQEGATAKSRHGQIGGHKA